MAAFPQRVRILQMVLVLVPLLVLLSACAPTAGLFAGGAWQASGLQNQQLHTLAVDPNNLQNIYAGDAQDGVFVSTDAGQNWTQHSTGLPLATSVHVLAFDDAGKKLYAATAAGVFVSADAAQHWSAAGTTETGLPADSYTALAFDLNAAHTIYAGTAHHGVLKSTNDGAGWSEASVGLPAAVSVNDLSFDADGHQLWAATDVGVYRSGDGGASWQAVNTGLPAGEIINTVLPASVEGGAQGLIFAGASHGLFISQDAGAHWAVSQESLNGIAIYALLFDYQKATTVYAATSIGALRSYDSGQTWGSVASGLPKNQAVYALAWGANGYSQLFAASKGIYAYPGSGSGFGADRIIPIVLILVFFYVLYVLVSRGRKRSRETFKPERIIETPPRVPPDQLAPYKAAPQNTSHTNNVRPIPPKLEVSSEGEDTKDGGGNDS